MNKINKCRVCGSENIEQYLDLGETPWCNQLITKEEFGTEKTLPLKLAFCHDCTASNLLETFSKEEMFSKHFYVSGTTKSLKEHFYNIAKDVTEKFNIKKDGLIVDVGGNDGTNLLQYKKLGYNNVVNIESAENIFSISLKNKIDTLNLFFEENTPEIIFKMNDNRKAKIINASGVFFHLEELHSVCKGIERLLDDDGVFVVQFMYIDDIIKKLQFDSIYHEHLLFYTRKSLVKMLERYGLYCKEFYSSDIHGGSTIAYFTKKKQEYIFEENNNLYDIKTYKQFSENVKKYKDKLFQILLKIKMRGYKIHAYGNPAKFCTLLNYTNIGKMIDIIEEANPLKHGYYTPITHIPIIHYLEIKERPQYYFISAWNFLKEFIQKEVQYLESGGNFIVPFPNEPFIINKENYKNYL